MQWMRDIIHKIGNAALVFGGFFVVLFGVSKSVNTQVDRQHAGAPPAGDALGVAHADAPSSAGDSADSGDSGGGDSADSGGGSADSGDSGSGGS